MFKRAIHAILRKTGHELIPTHCDLGTGFMLPFHLALALEKLKINCVFDVGANIGQYGRMLRGFGFSGHIFSFEPAKATFEGLKAAAKDDARWRVFNLALGAVCGKARLNTSPRSDTSSFLSPTPLYGELLQTSMNGSEQVELQTLDSLFDELTKEIPNPRPFLKLDTQGFDLEVVKGASRSIENFIGLQAELAVRHIYEGAPSYLESLKTYADLGFSLKNIYTVFETKDMSALELDCLMVRRLS